MSTRARSGDLAKRAMDLALAVPALVLALPVMAGIAVAIRLAMGPPVLFRQQRPGLHGEPFVLWKFRTMSRADGSEGAPLPDERRLTRLGRFLRRTSLDELPELFHVVSGRMSLVGPRPLLMKYLPLYDARQARRHEVRPGLTGWAQVHGRNALGWDQRLELDVWYVDHRSLALDARILARTAWIVLAGRGVYHEGEATMHEFRGSAR